MINAVMNADLMTHKMRDWCKIGEKYKVCRLTKRLNKKTQSNITKDKNGWSILSAGSVLENI